MVLLDVEFARRNMANLNQQVEEKLSARAPPVEEAKNQPAAAPKDSKGGFTEALPDRVTPEEQAQIDRSLLEVFNYYCRKFLNHKAGGDFGKLDKSLIMLGLNGFNSFCKNFKVPLDNTSITLVWKITSGNNTPLEFDQFQRSIT